MNANAAAKVPDVATVCDITPFRVAWAVCFAHSLTRKAVQAERKDTSRLDFLAWRRIAMFRIRSRHLRVAALKALGTASLLVTGWPALAQAPQASQAKLG